MQYDRRTILRGATIGLLGAGAGCLDSVGGTSEGANAPSTAAETRTTIGTEAGGGTEVGTGTGTGTETTTADPSTTAAPESDTTTATETGTEGAPTSSDGTSSASEASTATPTCESGLRRLEIDFPANYELAYREGFDFELTADPGTVAVGDDLAIELRNTADEPRTTGPKERYAIERAVEDGWRHVLQVPEGYTPPDGQVVHRPDEGFTWRFPANAEGFSAEPYTVCEPLQSGEYHFTYWGFPDARRGLTIEFEIE